MNGRRLTGPWSVLRLAAWPAACVAAMLAVPAVSASPLCFYTVAPCRALDTREPAGTYGGPALLSGSTRIVPLAGRCGIPASARAVAFNLTVTGSDSPFGDLTLYAADQNPAIVLLTFQGDRRTLANNGIVQVSADGQAALAIQASLLLRSTVQGILDVSGYFDEQCAVQSP